jgi:DNA-binding SARP family transcriptional activator/TolB-like protein
MIELRCLGSIDLLTHVHAPATRVIAQPKRFALLAHLLLASPRGFHRRDTLIALFWPEADDDHARSGLRIALSFLRHELGDELIVTRGDDVAVNRDALRCDVIEFETALKEGELEGALSLYCGDLLPGLHVSMSPEFDRWLEVERDRLRRQARDAALKLSASEEAAGHRDAAIRWLRSALKLAPDDEAIVQRLIKALDRAADRAGALRAYESFVEWMKSELDTAPSPETRALVASIRARSSGELHAIPSPTPNIAGIAAAATTVGAVIETPEPVHSRWMSPDHRATSMAIGVAVVLVLLGSSTIYWRSDRASHAPSTSVASVPSLAVLPFENLGKSEDAYFAAGITDEISSKLSTLGSLTVIGRQSAKRYVNTDKPPRQIGDELGATYLLTGTVRWDRSPTGRPLVRVTPVLLRASNGVEVWSQAYQGEASSVFDIQERVAEQVATAMRLSLSQADKQSLTARPTNSAEAYDYFLRAQNLGSIPGLPSEFLRAVALLQRAVQLDPTFAVGYAALGESHLNAYWSNADDNPERLKWAKAAIDTALDIDPKLPAAYVATATYYYRGTFEYQRGLDALLVAERLAPNDPDVLNLKGLIERGLGRWNDAIADHEGATRLDPRNPDILGDLCNALTQARRFAAAQKACDRAVASAPDKWSGYQLSYRLALERGDVNGALAIVRDAESRVDREEFRNGLLENGGWPWFFDAHLLTEMDSVPAPPGARARVSYFACKVYLSVYTKDLRGARQFADSILANAAKAISGAPFFDTDVHSSLAMAYAAKGDNQRRLKETELTLRAIPSSLDAIQRISMLQYLANSAVLAGSYDEALSQLKQILAVPSSYSIPSLRVDPWFDRMRSNPGFQQLLASGE